MSSAKNITVKSLHTNTLTVEKEATANTDLVNRLTLENYLTTTLNGVTSLAAGTSLIATPDPITSTGTLDLEDAPVDTAGTYSPATSLTIDQKGIVTGVSRKATTMKYFWNSGSLPINSNRVFMNGDRADLVNISTIEDVMRFDAYVTSIYAWSRFLVGGNPGATWRFTLYVDGTPTPVETTIDATSPGTRSDGTSGLLHFVPAGSRVAMYVAYENGAVTSSNVYHVTIGLAPA